MVLIYSPKHSARLQYACRIVFEIHGQQTFSVTHDLSVFAAFDGVKINYSDEAGLAGIQICPANLLFETGYRADNRPALAVWDGLKVIYPTPGEHRVPFDLFSAVFFMLSRCEEYGDFQGDEHGRFCAEDSLAFQYGFLQEPIVEKWISKVQQVIKTVYAKFQPGVRKFDVLSTIDIDSAFAYRQKGLVRMLGGFAKDLLAFDFSNFKRRFAVVFKGAHDPFDSYKQILEIQKASAIPVMYFVLMASYGLNDKNVPWYSRHFQLLIKELGDYSVIGIHPGYMSNQESDKLAIEIDRLSRVLHRDIIHSRQHFLMLRMPDTYRKLVANGISNDYSMGFASQFGFRAGTSLPFPFFDLETEEQLPLTVHPFAVMDATLNRYLGYSPEEAGKIIQSLIDEVASVGGRFVSLWHNESLSEMWHWEGWSGIYKDMMDYAAKKTQ